ncbi:MAG: GNAT family N-acetyltransferase [Clostridia bacterium]|nr:GNAT family N-acetyltransferase [Clostridia bacterium]
MKFEMSSSKRIPELKTLWKEAFNDTDEYIDNFFETAYSDKRCMIASENDEVCGVIYWFDCNFFSYRIAYFYAIATKKSYRGMGVCTRLMDNAHSFLSSNGYDAVILVPGERSLFDFYRNMGYTVGSYIDEISVEAKDGPLDIREIDGYEYSELRKTYLPKNGVIQENENIKYLEKQAKLYTGEDFLLSCYVVDDVLMGIELLGNTEIAPNIASALGCRKGKIRTVGDKKPFSMYYNLKNHTLPAVFYFGLAFD